MIEYSSGSAASAIKRHFKGRDSHFSQNLPVKPSTHWHCCQDQWSKQVPPCLQGLAVQAPSSLGHLQTHKTTISLTSQQHSLQRGGPEGVRPKRETPKNKKKKTRQMSRDFYPHAAIHKNPIKNSERISILKDLSSLHYSPAGRKRKNKISGILQLVPPSHVKNLPFVFFFFF